jgi:AcrR family transcriptional regulator
MDVQSSPERSRQPKTSKIPPRARILSAATELFSRHGIGAVSIEAIAKAAASSKVTLHYHFGSKDELVAEYMRESARRADAFWTRVETTNTPGAFVPLSAWLAEMAGGLVDGCGCRFTNAAAELQERSHPARRVIKAYKVLQRRRLTRLCRASGLAKPSMLADALLLLFDGACVMAQSFGGVGVSSRFIHLGEAMIAARARRRLAARQEHRP